MALDFDGMNDTIALGAVGLLRNIPAWTLMAWIRPDVIKTSTFLSVGIGPPPGSTSVSRASIEILSASGDFITAARRLDADAATTFTSATGEAVAGTLYHVAATCTYTNPIVLRLYKNGVLLGTTSAAAAAGNSSDTNTKNAAIGSEDNGASNFFDGRIEDARIYTRALSADEIATVFAAQGTDSIVDGLQARYPLYEASPGTTAPAGSPVKDVSDSKFNGSTGSASTRPIYREILTIRRRRGVC